ncbi:MAG TPA: Slp family lipoprotein [Candidatus Sulfotelmatobacter sp.]|nr:Slp family lipoprotein [Candidatus Sulfotelmatobacter sp.]
MDGKAVKEKELAARQRGYCPGFEELLIRGSGLNAVKCLALACLLAVFSGCSSYPFPRELWDKAQVISISDVRANPDASRGAIVIWGGRIVNVVNDTNGSSIYIVGLPLRSSGRPRVRESSPGRFIATTSYFLDPEMFPQHALITIAGQLDGVWTEQLGNLQYPYPVVDIQSTYVWPPEQDSNVAFYAGPSWGPGWGPGWGWGAYPWWGPGFYYPVGVGFYGRGFHGSIRGRPGFRAGPAARGGPGFRGGPPGSRSGGFRGGPAGRGR